MEKQLKQLAKEARNIQMTKGECETTRAFLLEHISQSSSKKEEKRIKSPYAKKMLLVFQRSVVFVLIIAISFNLSKPVSAKSLPGDLLYPIKIIHEEIEVAKIHNPKKKAEYQIKRAEKRIEEVRKLKKNHKLDSEKEHAVVEKLKEHVEEVHKAVQEIKKEEPKSALEINNELASTLQESVKVLKEATDTDTSSNDDNDTATSPEVKEENEEEINLTEEKENNDKEIENEDISDPKQQEEISSQDELETEKMKDNPIDSIENEESPHIKQEDSKEDSNETTDINTEDSQNSLPEEEKETEKINPSSLKEGEVRGMEDNTDKFIDDGEKTLPHENLINGEISSHEQKDISAQEETQEETGTLLLDILKEEVLKTEEIKIDIEKKASSQIKEDIIGEQEEPEKVVEENEKENSYENEVNSNGTEITLQEKDSEEILKEKSDEYKIIKKEIQTLEEKLHAFQVKTGIGEDPKEKELIEQLLKEEKYGEVLQILQTELDKFITLEKIDIIGREKE